MTSFDNVTKLQEKVRWHLASEQLIQLLEKGQAFKHANLSHPKKNQYI